MEGYYSTSYDTYDEYSAIGRDDEKNTSKSSSQGNNVIIDPTYAYANQAYAYQVSPFVVVEDRNYVMTEQERIDELRRQQYEEIDNMLALQQMEAMHREAKELEEQAELENQNSRMRGRKIDDLTSELESIAEPDTNTRALPRRSSSRTIQEKKRRSRRRNRPNVRIRPEQNERKRKVEREISAPLIPKIPVQNELSKEQEEEDKKAKKYKKLLQIMNTYRKDRQPLLSYFPTEDEEDVDKSEETYNLADQKVLDKRDFRTRIFFSDYTINGNNAWIRTRHTDVGERPHIDYVREYYEASFDAENHTAAKATLAGIMDCIFNMDNPEYYNFATIMASGLSQDASYVAFEGTTNAKDKYRDMMSKRRFLLLTDIIFKTIYSKRFLDENSNIFRLVHANLKGNRNKTSIIYCIFSFLLQGVMGAFVCAQVFKLAQSGSQPPADPELRYGLYVLAALGSLFGLAVTLPDITNYRTIYKCYGRRIGIIYLMDMMCNIVIPLFLIGVGCYLVTLQADYINGVIFTTALLFIPEIDDQLPSLLGFDQTAIIENYLIGEAKIAYDRYMKLSDDEVNKIFTSGKSKNVDKIFNQMYENGEVDIESMQYHNQRKVTATHSFGIDCCDFFLTNSIMIGSDSHDFSQAFKVHYRKNGSHELDPSNFITEDCLLKQIDFRYVDSSKTHPSIGFLRLTKMNDEVIEIDFSKQGINFDRGDSLHTLRGAFIVTNFVMTSNDIESLQLFGSNNGKNLLHGLQYYSLWDTSFGARRLLQKF